MKALSETEIKELIRDNLKGWSFDGTFLVKSFKFKDFVNAFSFMTAIAIQAEKIDHHPDWANVYNTVNIKLNTHDAHGITKLDSDLAHIIEDLYSHHA
jgi:4a-hydroxytetrahydrobiopterin dehydratase